MSSYHRKSEIIPHKEWLLLDIEPFPLLSWLNTLKVVTSMNILTALLPHKHTLFSESLIGVAGFINSLLPKNSVTIDELWALIEINQSKYPNTVNFEQMILATDILFAINILDLHPDGRIQKSLK